MMDVPKSNREKALLLLKYCKHRDKKKDLVPIRDESRHLIILMDREKAIRRKLIKE